MTITHDFETRSEADLKKVGPWAYSQHPSTEIICMGWALDDGPVERWGNPAVGFRHFGEYPSVLDYVGHEDFEAHNAAFEIAIWFNVCRRMGWPVPSLERFRDTMAVACYYAMPPALDNLCHALGIPGKDKEGDRLITKYSKLHLKTAKRIIAEEDKPKWLHYVGIDVERERQAGDILGELPEEELEVFLHDLRVSYRGLKLDEKGIVAAQMVVEQRAGELKREFNRLTGLNPGQVAAFMGWLAARGLELPNLRAATIDELLDEDRIGDDPAPVLSRDVRRAVEVRKEFARASTKKLNAMLRQRGSDGRARFQTRYHGASTGRNTGTGFQPLNLVRNWEGVDPQQLVNDVHRAAEYGPRWLDALYGDAMEAVGKASRHWIEASEGCRIMAGDFSSIEAVVNACLAGEEWKIQLFKDGGDPYVTFASKVVGRQVLPKSHPDVTKQDLDDRQKKGKPGDLAGGYQGWVGAWRKFDRTDNFTDDEVAKFMGAWRELHPNIVKQWAALEDAAIEATLHPGRVTGWRDQELFERVDGWLTMILPDGKRLWYWMPQVRMAWPRWHRPLEDERCARGECRCEKKPQLTYMAQKEGRFRRVSTYGGKVCENRVQAISRQLLKPAEMAVEAAYYPVILSVYDEIICDVPIYMGSANEFYDIVAEAIDKLDWARGWPIRMDKPWEGPRYKK